MVAPLLISLLSLLLCQTATWAYIGNPANFNSIQDSNYPDLSPGSQTNDVTSETEDSVNDGNTMAEENDNTPLVQTIDDETEMQFPKPIQWVSIDHLRNSIILRFQSPTPKILNKLDTEEMKRLRSLQENAMRWGKRSYESYPLSRNGLPDKSSMGRMDFLSSHQVIRDSRGDNFMRFGRSAGGASGNDENFMRFGRSTGKSSDFMRFGRAGQDNFMRFGRAGAGQDFMRFGRSAGPNFMRFGRAGGQDFMRFGRAASGQDFMRFGRAPSGQDFMRFGRAPSGQDFMRFGRGSGQDFMRFGRAPSGQDFMRFGRDPSSTQDFMRFGRPDNFMRFGRTPPKSSDFMRFGKSLSKSENKTSTQQKQQQQQLGKNELKQAVKLIHEADKNAENGNPVDTAIKALFDKHELNDHLQQHVPDNSDENHLADATLHENNSDEQNNDLDYFFTMKMAN
ncbi:FMRFamide related propeptide [Musca autumnalis]|uniref:FMRFamide related propeptide n=1 Tax=Musca autumnalis TaxID=221902 RepID=UPI003CF3036B